MSGQNEQLRRTITCERVWDAIASEKRALANLALEHIGLVLDVLAAAPAVAITQAATSGLHNAILGLACNEMHAGSPNADVRRAYGEGFRRAREEAAELVAAAPAVAITQAATSEPVAWHRLCARLGGVCTCETLTCALLEHAAPVAHLAGTTPNTEAPSDAKTAALDVAVKALERISVWSFGWDGDCGVTSEADRALDDVRAALSAQQAGVREAPSEDAKGTRNYALKFARLTLAFNPPSEVQRKSAIHVIDAALAAATQTEKP